MHLEFIKKLIAEGEYVTKAIIYIQSLLLTASCKF